MKKKYEEGIKVKLNKKGRLQIKDSNSHKPTVTDLVYIHQSPTYCEKNATFGILGIFILQIITICTYLLLFKVPKALMVFI